MATVLKQGRMSRRGNRPDRRVPDAEVLQSFRGFADAMTQLARQGQVQRLPARS